MATGQGWVTSAAQRLAAAWKALRHGGADVLRQPTGRRRALILVAAVLVSAYALGVHCYVLLTPDIGVRCAFTPVVNTFFPEYLCPDGQDPLQAGDRIVRVGAHEVP